MNLDLDDAVGKALKRLANCQSESDVREHVIGPLLRAMGYEDKYRTEVQTARGTLDYMVLYDDKENGFCLEAKGPAVQLGDKEAIQATGYANDTKFNWAVLTNGRDWRVYNAWERAEPSGQLLVEVCLDTREEAIAFFKAIAEPSVSSGMLKENIARFVLPLQENRRKAEEEGRIGERCRQVLEQEVVAADSPLVVAICEHLKVRDGLNGVKAEQVASFFRHQPPLPPQPLTDDFPAMRFLREFRSYLQRQENSIFRNCEVGQAYEGNAEVWLNDSKFYEKSCWPWLMLGSKRYYVGLWIGGKTPSNESRTVYDELLKRRLGIEKALKERGLAPENGFVVIWGRENRKQDIVVKISISNKALEDRSQWPSLMQGMAALMSKFSEALAPYMEQLPQVKRGDRD